MDSGSPTSVSYGHHGKWSTLGWAGVDKVEGDHVVAYSALGSHGNWPTADCHKYPIPYDSGTV